LKSKATFAEEVYRLTSQIPEGRVSTYGAIPRELKRPKAGRAVGRILASNPRPIVVPCHRVVSGDGGLRGYSAPGGLAAKARILRREGVEVENLKVDLSRYMFSDFRP
jgi:methylated-DNA-[protein]-cysteine S-methyltransferase